MATPHGMVEFDKSMHDVKEALDVLTATLGEVRGCEYPRLIVACLAQDRAKHAPVGHPAEPEREPAPASAPAPVLAPAPALADEPSSPSPDADTVQLMALLEAREAEISQLRDLLHHAVDTIEAHTLTDPDGTAVMLHGDYQCISAAAIEQWLDRAETALKPAGQPGD